MTKKITLTLIMSLLSMLLFTTSSHAAPVKSIQVKHYTIYPRTQYDILRELNWRSPIKENGRTFHGNTDWDIKWRFNTQQLSTGCKFFAIQTHLNIQYTLPELDKGIKDAAIVHRFNKFSRALVKHEHNHGLNGIKAAQEIDNALHKLPPQYDCHKLERHANNLGQSIVRKYTAIDDEYDRTTRHGQTEGAFIN